MPIKWSAVEVSEAMDKIEAEINKAAPYLEQAKAIARQARGISNLPLYVEQVLHGFEFAIEAAVGDGHHEGSGNLRGCIRSVRDRIPDGAIEAEREFTRHGKTERLM
jgi:hypothetical protein